MSAHRAKRRRLDIVYVSSDESDDEPVQNKRLRDEEKATTSKEPPPPPVIDLIEQKSDDEQWSNESKEDNDTFLATCRLRHGLNEDCLCEIFKFLGVYDLIQLCELDIYFQNLITKWVIGKKLINFTKMDPCWTTNKIFQIFGKSMRRIKIAEENTLGSFERFLTFVTQNCAVGGLTHIELRFSEPTASQIIMDQSMPHFANLRKLVLNDNYTRVHYGEFLAGIAATATYLTHLTLEGINVSGQWLTSGGLVNLKELRLHASKRRAMEIKTTELAEFLRTKPKLEVFSHIGGTDISDVVDALTDYCPKLKAYADFHLKNPYKNQVVASLNANAMQRYRYVRQFDDVTKLGITSYTLCGSDLYYPLVKLAARNRVEALKIYTDRNSIITLDEDNRMHYSQKDFSHFTRLRSIELQIRSEHSGQIQLNSEFICEFVAKLINIQKFTVKCEPAVGDLHKVIDMAPHLNKLGISQAKMKYLPVEMLKIVRSIRKRRANMIALGLPQPEPFHLVVNVQQWRELQVYKDADTILKTTVDHTDCNHSFNVAGV